MQVPDVRSIDWFLSSDHKTEADISAIAGGVNKIVMISSTDYIFKKVVLEECDVTFDRRRNKESQKSTFNSIKLYSQVPDSLHHIYAAQMVLKGVTAILRDNKSLEELSKAYLPLTRVLVSCDTQTFNYDEGVKITLPDKTSEGSNKHSILLDYAARAIITPSGQENTHENLIKIEDVKSDLFIHSGFLLFSNLLINEKLGIWSNNLKKAADLEEVFEKIRKLYLPREGEKDIITEEIITYAIKNKLFPFNPFPIVTKLYKI